MADSGVPTHMTLKPAGAPGYVLHCYNASLRVFARDEWERAGAEGTPLFRLTEMECHALSAFLAHWIGDEDFAPGVFRGLEGQVEYEG